MTDQLIAEAAASRKYHTLDGLRGIAAVAVVIFHVGALTDPIVTGSSYLAVDLFFVMSGFVIAHAYDPKLAAGMSTWSFMLARYIRLYPLYILGTALLTVPTLAALVLHRTHVWTWPSFLSVLVPAALMLPCPPVAGKHVSLYILNPPAWSLFFELCVNLAFAAAFSSLDRRRLWMIVTVSAVALLGVIAVYGYLDQGWQWLTLWAGFARVFFSFFVGVIIYRAHRAGKLPTPRVPPALILLAALLVFLIPSYIGLARPIVDLLSVFLLWPVLVILAVANEPTRNVRTYTFLGIISYPIYVIHLPIVSAINAAVEKLFAGSVDRYAPWIGLTLVGALIALSWWLAETYDRAARNLLKKWAGA